MKEGPKESFKPRCMKKPQILRTLTCHDPLGRPSLTQWLNSPVSTVTSRPERRSDILYNFLQLASYLQPSEFHGKIYNDGTRVDGSRTAFYSIGAGLGSPLLILKQACEMLWTGRVKVHPRGQIHRIYLFLPTRISEEILSIGCRTIYFWARYRPY